MVAIADRLASGEALLLEPSTRVTCPKCEHEFSLEAGFAKKSLEAIEHASAEALSGVRAGIAATVQARLEREAREREELSQSELRALRKLVKDRDEQHAAALKETRELEKRNVASQIERMQEMVAERDLQLGALLTEREALARKEQALAAREQTLKEQVAREARAQAEQLAVQARSQITDELQEKSRLKEAELQKTIDDMRAKLEEAQRKGDQGSQQLQGEVLELLLEEALAQAFPLDSVTEVKKGVRGGDAVHSVTTRTGQVAGVILWEAKRAQNWNRQWTAKLKADMRECGAVAGVIVTTTFPPEWPEGRHFGLHDEVWLTSAAAAVPLAAVLREGLFDAHKARIASANKGEKMEAVYDYLTSTQFAHKLKAVYDAFSKLRTELDSERTATLQRWKRREKQIESATVQLIGIAGDLQGLAQQDLPQLELAPPVLESPADEESE